MTTGRLFNLPSDLFTFLVTEWLKPDEVINLDFAVCNKVHRSQWLKHLQNECVFQTVSLGNRRSMDYTRWYVARHIRARNVLLHDSQLLDNESVFKWWHNTSNNIVTLALFISDASKVADLLPICSNLKSLSLRCCSIDALFWDAVCSHANLQQLTLDYCQFDCSNSQAMSNITRLVIKVPTEAFGDVNFSLKQFPGLQSLTLWMHRFPNNYSLQTNWCPQLVELDFSRAFHQEVDNEQFQKLMRSLKRGLRCLVLPERQFFTSIELESIVENHSHSLVSLKFADRADATIYTAADVVNLVNGLTHLRTLIVSDIIMYYLRAQLAQIRSSQITYMKVDFDTNTCTKLLLK